jgi:hypothetical protein
MLNHDGNYFDDSHSLDERVCMDSQMPIKRPISNHDADSGYDDTSKYVVQDLDSRDAIFTSMRITMVLCWIALAWTMCAFLALRKIRPTIPPKTTIIPCGASTDYVELTGEEP